VLTDPIYVSMEYPQSTSVMVSRSSLLKVRWRNAPNNAYWKGSVVQVLRALEKRAVNV
jgi:hypothetical protein